MNYKISMTSEIQAPDKEEATLMLIRNLVNGTWIPEVEEVHEMDDVVKEKVTLSKKISDSRKQKEITTDSG